jgi:SAM-dependent methyltransferase
MLELETSCCPLCGAAECATVFAGAGFAPFALQSCASCGLHYLSPRLTESAITQHYASDRYFAGDGYTDYQQQEASLRGTFSRFLRALAQRGCTGGSLLEVGCGYGYLLDEAQVHFERRVGIDFSPGAVQRAAALADAAYQGGIEALPASEPVFDCVVATHVVEHVYHPRAFVKALMARLRPGGHLVLATPDAGSFWRLGMGRRWPSFKLPEHVLYFNRRTLGRLMEDAGLQRLQPVPYPHAFPLPLIAAKLGLSVPRAVRHLSLWLPATTLAIAGVKPHV